MLRNALLTKVGDPLIPVFSGTSPMSVIEQIFICFLFANLIPLIKGLVGSKVSCITQIKAGRVTLTVSIPYSNSRFKIRELSSYFTNSFT